MESEIQKIQNKISEYVEMMEIKDRQIIPPSEAEYRASLFLTACAFVVDLKAQYSELHHVATAKTNVAYKMAIGRAGGRNITESKVNADADPEYAAAQKEADDLEEKADYFSTYYQLFTNAHIFYRQMSSQIHRETKNGL